jgi:hypothetical protein
MTEKAIWQGSRGCVSEAVFIAGLRELLPQMSILMCIDVDEKRIVV